MLSPKSKRKRLFLIDGYAILYRAHFAFIRNPLITSYGLHTSALYGFINQVFRLIKNEQPDYLAAVFDSKEKTFRHKRYPEYKATREKMPDELREQIPHLWDLLNAMQIVSLSKPGFEADDIIGTLAINGAEHDLDVYIISGDKDFMQLVNNHIFLYAPGGRNMTTKIYDRTAVVEKWGLPPEQIRDMLGLMGDASDNIPGVRGVGEKSAVKLLQEYGSLPAVLDNAEKISNKRVRTGLLECKEEALLSQELVTIDTNVEVDCEIDDLKRNKFDTETLEKLLKEYEFYAFVNQLKDFKSEPIVIKKESYKNYNTIMNPSEMNSFTRSIDTNTLVSFDLETTSVDPMQADIVGISFSVEKDTGVYIPIWYKDKKDNNFGKDDLAVVLDSIKSFMENPEISKTGQNVKFDTLILKRQGIEVQGIIFDTMIAAHLIDPAARSYKLNKLALEFLNYEMVPIEDLIGSGRNQISMAEVELDKVAFYAAEDADIALQLTHIFKDKLSESELETLFNTIEMPLVSVLIDMEYAGMYVDKELLTKMSVELGKKLHSLITAIIREAGTEFNINSTQQLAHILFDILELPQIRKRSTAEEVLERLKDRHPLPGLLLEYRKLNKLKNTYLDPFPTLIHPLTGRVHSSFSQTVAATGRLASSNPNFQNIPIRTDIGREIRKAFRPQEKGWKIFSADYSQIELRIMAHLSQDAALIEAFNNDEDIHSRTASDVYGVPIGDVLPEMRRTAKIVNFGIMYGAGPFRMSQELGIPHREAAAIIKAYFDKYAGIKDYIDRTLEQARKLKYVQTLLGRRRPVWEADSDNRVRREAAERMAINMPIQGTAAEMIKLAMIKIHNELNNGLKARMILQIHDELLFEVPENEVQELTDLVIKEMEQALPLSVPVKVECGVGNSWFEAH